MRWKRIASGELYASSTVARRLLEMLASGLIETSRERCGLSSNCELQALRSSGSGFGTSPVATELQLCVKTLEAHRQRIKQKLRLTNGMELARRAAEWRLDAARGRGGTNGEKTASGGSQ
jgi:DNA-binding NarL/FixJ family response regulator